MATEIMEYQQLCQDISLESYLICINLIISMWCHWINISLWSPEQTAYCPQSHVVYVK